MPPFRSESQRRFMYSQKPELAEEFEEATPKNKKLPEHVKVKQSQGRHHERPRKK